MYTLVVSEWKGPAIHSNILSLQQILETVRLIAFNRCGSIHHILIFIVSEWYLIKANMLPENLPEHLASYWS